MRMRPKFDAIIVFPILAGHREANLDRSLGALFSYWSDSFPPKFIVDRFLRIEQVVAQKPDSLHQIGFPCPATPNQHRYRVKFELHFADALEVTYLNPPNHRFSEELPIRFD